MDEKKTDRRSLKTQKLIKEALAELLTEKELRQITVQEVSDKADIHRVTFYKHYYGHLSGQPHEKISDICAKLPVFLLMI